MIVPEATIRIGVIFPQTEIGPDPGAVRAFAEAAEDLGYDHLVAFDHVLGVDTSNRPNWSGAYTHKDLFHEPFVLFGHLAAVTHRLELVTGVIILGQRQTVLVAKQAAEVDVLSGGRLRLGIGIGWNPVEYEALGENFHIRGKRSEEQVEVLRALWSQEVVTFEGRWHRIIAAGLNPLPVQRPIPIWFGGGQTETVMRRIARLADGWFPQRQPDQQGQEALEQLRQFARDVGRDPDSIGIEGRVQISHGVDAALDNAKKWERLGATHVDIYTMRAGFHSVDEHINAIRAFKEGLDK